MQQLMTSTFTVMEFFQPTDEFVLYYFSRKSINYSMVVSCVYSYSIKSVIDPESETDSRQENPEEEIRKESSPPPTASDRVTSTHADADASVPASDDYRTAITNVNNGVATDSDVAVLRYMLKSSSPVVVADGLKLVVSLSERSSSDTKELIFACGVGDDLIRLIRSRKQLPRPSLLQLITCVSNLSLSQRGQVVFKDLVADVTDVVVLCPELSRQGLMCLTNLSVTEASHPGFIKIVSALYRLMDDYPNERLYVLRTLVNLSANADMVAHLLAAKAPRCSLELLRGDEEKLVRWLRVLVALSGAVLRDAVKESDLPVVAKAPSPETVYSLLFGVEASGQLTAVLLSSRKNASVSSEAKELASQLYKNVTAGSQD